MKMKASVIALLCLASLASATPIHWYSHLDHTNLDSQERFMDEGFRFELGVFRDGFVPTASNRSEWSAYWEPAQRVQYNADHGWYSGYFIVENNEAPFAAGTEAWVWGFSGDASSGDWILFRNSNWKWPRANASMPVVRQWNAKEGDTTLIGSVSTTDSSELMQAEAVENAVPPPTTFEQWVQENGRSTAQENLIPFATGSKQQPVKATRITDANGELSTEIRLTHLADRQLRTVGIEVSEDLINWEPYTRYASLKQTSPTELIFELDPEAEAQPKLFFRGIYER